MRPCLGKALVCCALTASLGALAAPSACAHLDPEALAPRQAARGVRDAHHLHSLRSEVADYAQQLLGVPYKLGGTDPESGLDCSGLVRYVFERVADITLPRTVLAMSRVGEWIPRARLRRGDLVFFHTRRARFSHVGIYVGHGRFVHAPRPGTEVEVGELRDPYWSRHFSGARRVLLPSRLAAR